MSGYIKHQLEDYNDSEFLKNTFRKISIPAKDASGDWQVLKIYQALNNNQKK